MRRVIIIIVSLFFALMIIALAKNTPITGYATFATPKEVEQTLIGLTSGKAVQNLGDGARFCFVIDIDENTTYLFDVVKKGKLVNIKQENCADPGQDNIIVKFQSYDFLLQAQSRPKWFFENRRNSGYYIWPSANVKEGGEVNCTQSFQEKYCGALFSQFTSQEIDQKLGLPCCAAYRFAPSTPVGLAFTSFANIDDYWWAYILGLIVIVGLIYMLGSKHNKN